MTYQEFNHFCDSLTATSYVIQWRAAHVWKAGGKVFAIGGWEKVENGAFTFKIYELNFHFLSDKMGYRPAPYLASRGMKWIQQYDVPDTKDDDELLYYLSKSHRIVSLGLSNNPIFCSSFLSFQHIKMRSGGMVFKIRWFFNGIKLHCVQGVQEQ
jgi:predicted DNA-binding protein (MmcQ/YjbR family)